MSFVSHVLPISYHLENVSLCNRFCHLLVAQCLLCLLLLSTFLGLHLSLFLTVVSIKCDLPHQPTSMANANPSESHLQFLWFLILPGLLCQHHLIFFCHQGQGFCRFLLFERQQRIKQVCSIVHHSPVISAGALIPRATVHRLCHPERVLYS